MNLLNVGFVGDVSLGKNILADVTESGHNVLFFSENLEVNECFDLIVITDNCQRSLRLLHKHAKHVILISSTISRVVDYKIIKNNTNLCIYFIPHQESGYLCRYTSGKGFDVIEGETVWLRDQITDITIVLSRGDNPEPSLIPYCMNEKYYSETPKRIRRLVSILLQRLGDQSGGICVSNFAYHTWLADTKFLMTHEDQASIDDSCICHFFSTKQEEQNRINM